MSDTEYIVVSDNSSEVLLSTQNWIEAKQLAGKIRKSGGACTIFKSTKG